MTEFPAPIPREVVSSIDGVISKLIDMEMRPPHGNALENFEAELERGINLVKRVRQDPVRYQAMDRLRLAVKANDVSLAKEYLSRGLQPDVSSDSHVKNFLNAAEHKDSTMFEALVAHSWGIPTERVAARQFLQHAVECLGRSSQHCSQSVKEALVLALREHFEPGEKTVNAYADRLTIWRSQDVLEQLGDHVSRQSSKTLESTHRSSGADARRPVEGREVFRFGDSADSRDRSMRPIIRGIVHQLMESRRSDDGWPQNLEAVESAFAEGLAKVRQLRQDPPDASSWNVLKKSVSEGDVNAVRTLLKQGLKPIEGTPFHAGIFADGARCSDGHLLQTLQMYGWGVPQQPLAAHEFLQLVVSKANEFSEAGSQTVAQLLKDHCKPGESVVKSFAQNMLNAGRLEVIDSLGTHLPERPDMFRGETLPAYERIETLARHGVPLRNEWPVTRFVQKMLADMGTDNGIDAVTAHRQMATVMSLPIAEGSSVRLGSVLESTVLSYNSRHTEELSERAYCFMAEEIRQRCQRDDPLVSRFQKEMFDQGRIAALDALGDHMNWREVVCQGGGKALDVDHLDVLASRGVRWSSGYVAGTMVTRALDKLSGNSSQDPDEVYRYLQVAMNMKLKDGTAPTFPRVMLAGNVSKNLDNLAKFSDEQLRGLGQFGLFEPLEDTRTMAFLCVEYRKPELLKRIVQCGADVKQVFNGKDTLAHVLTQLTDGSGEPQDDVRTMAALIDAGVDIQARDSKGRTAEVCARRAGRQDLVDLIKAKQVLLGISEETAPKKRASRTAKS